jgi:hypothetical protein
VESSRRLGAADLHRREYMLLRVLGYNHLTSRTPSRDTRDDLLDPTVRSSSPQYVLAQTISEMSYEALCEAI